MAAQPDDVEAESPTGRGSAWWPKDAGWWRRGDIGALVDEFKATGAAVIDWLACECTAQDGYTRGTVTASYRAIAQSLGSAAPEVTAIVNRAAELGLLDGLDAGPVSFTCTLAGWREERERYVERMRKARYREEQKAKAAQEAGA
jgi:hypothetical protein